MRHFICLSLLACAAAFAAAEDVALIGVIGDKAAVLALEGGEPKTVKVGQTWSGVTVIAVSREQATVEIDGVVVQQGPGVALLGMSFLNRLEMKRDGDTMTLTRRF